MAIEHFENAYEYFQPYNHLKGMYLAKKHIFHMSDMKEILVDEVKHLRDEYKKYWVDVGLIHSVYIPREHGDEISLLTELVLDCHEEAVNLFPVPNKDDNTETALNEKKLREK